MEVGKQPSTITHTGDSWKLQVNAYFEIIELVVTTNSGKLFRSKFNYEDLPYGIKENFKTMKEF